MKDSAEVLVFKKVFVIGLQCVLAPIVSVLFFASYFRFCGDRLSENGRFYSALLGLGSGLFLCFGFHISFSMWVCFYDNMVLTRLHAGFILLVILANIASFGFELWRRSSERALVEEGTKILSDMI